MNANDYGSLPNKKTSTDSGLYANGSVYSRPQQAQAYTYHANSNAPRENSRVNSYQNMQSTNRAVYDSAASNGRDRSYAARNNGYSGYQPPQNSARVNDSHTPATGGTQSYRTNYSAAKQSGYASSATASGNGAVNGTKVNMTGNGGKNGGNGNGTVNGNGNGKKPPKKKSIKQRFLAWLKRFLRSIYLLGKPVRIFLASATGFVLICIIVIISVSSARKNNEEAISAELTLTTPVPTVAPTATPEPTPSPTPEIRIEKGAEGEDVMALQKRLMELGYLAIDEPTSYFGNATKAALKLFQRQHELQQDGICGAETIEMIYAEEAQPYVMKEGEEGDDIQSFQEQLVELGYLDSNQVTSYYGTDTVDAVKDFQRRNYLTKDGKAGEKTLEAINSPDARVSYTKEQEIIAEKKKQAALARASSAAGRIDKLINAAKKQLGDPYILGKSGPDSFDCSGLVVYCLRQANVYTRRLNAAGLSKTTSWKKISDIDDLQRGDLIFFKSDDSSTVGHVGIYIGGGEMIDASSANGKVVRRSAKTSYWRRNFVVGRRPIV